MEAANPAMTFDEVSMERSKSFIKALQELKNLRPQLYSAAEYCEKSYLHSEQKQMVLDNLKDYAVRALVNAVDHLGTVAYKLTDLLEQQTLDATTMDLKVSTLNQQLLTCQIYTGKEGLRQQQLLAFIPRHHKHYMLPNSAHRKVYFSPRLRADASLSYFQAKAGTHHSGTPAAKTLSWHLASETKSTLRKSSRSSTNRKFSSMTSGVFQLLDTEESVGKSSTQIKSLQEHIHLPNGGSASSTAMQTLGITHKDALEGSKPLTAYRSFDNLNRHENEMALVPARSKSVLSAFFAKQKTSKLKAGYVS